MAATHRHELELKRKSESVKRTTNDPLEKLRCCCLEKGTCGIKGIGR